MVISFRPIRPTDEIYNAQYNTTGEDSECMFQSQIFVSDRKNIEVVVSSTCFLCSVVLGGLSWLFLDSALLSPSYV